MATDLGMQVNAGKVGALLEYICAQMPHIHLRKLLKVIYLIDEKSVKMRYIPLTWLNYYAWKKGPVSPAVYNVKTGAFTDYVTCKKEEDGKWHVVANKTYPYAIEKDLKVFSAYEMDIINSVIAQCEDKSADELTDQTHSEDSLWSQTVAQYGISFAESGRSDHQINLNELNDEDGKEVYMDALDSMMMQASLNAMSNV